MTDALVNISHPTDPTVDIPFIGSRGPFEKIVVPSWQAKSIAEQGFTVEVIKEPYDPVEEHNAQVRAKAAAKAAAKAQEPVEPVEPVIPAATAEAESETPEPAQEEVAEETTEEAVEEVTEEVAEEEGEPLTEEQKQELRDAINGLSSFAEAKQFLAEQQVVLEPMPSKLKDIKAALLAMVE